MEISNVNRNNVSATGNTGKITTGAGGYLEPALIRAVVLVPTGTKIPPSAMVSQSAFSTYVDALFVANTRSTRWFMFTDLDAFKDETKKASSEDTGVLQTMVYKYAPKYSFRYMTGMGNFQEMLQFQNWGGDYYFIDQNGSWDGWYDPNGDGSLCAYTNYQLFVEDMGRTTDKTANQYMFSVQAKNREQYNDNFAYYAANTDFDAVPMLRNVWLTDETAKLSATVPSYTATTDVILCATINERATDFIQYFQSVLTAACFTAFDTTTGLAVTIASAVFGEIAVAGQTYYYAKLRVSAAPTAGDIVRYSLAAPSVTQPIILANVITELPNTASHTF